jgi:3-hydroxyacyl-CoA dehydrogenase
MIDSMQQELVAKGVLTQWDQTISDKSKGIFSRANSLDEAIQLEREAFIALCKEGLSVARIKHMLESGKPLRN